MPPLLPSRRFPFPLLARPNVVISAVVTSLLAQGSVGARLRAQLPAAAPTQMGQPAASQPAATPASPPATRRPHHLQVTFSNGLLTVQATNASLNGAIREISRQTGMRVTGSVAEDRVFGTYGPADPQKVLAALLDGTGVNLLIVSDAAEAPVQLVLSPRTGAATPPASTNGADGNDDEDQGGLQFPQPAIQGPRQRSAMLPGRVPPAPPSAPPASPGAQTDVQTGAQAADDQLQPDQPAAASANDTGSDTSGNGVKTPQQIFEQLQKLRQGPAATPTPTPQ